MNIADSIRKIAKSDDENYSLVGIVQAVIFEDRTCTVAPISGDAVLYKVKLQANQKLDIGLVAFPKVGSEVIVTFLNKQTGFVSMCTEIDKVQLDIEEQSLFLDKDGLKFEGKGQNLFDSIKELIDILKNFQLATNQGPTIEVMPHLKLRLENLETSFGKFLK